MRRSRLVPAVLLGPLLLWAASLDLVPAYLLGVGLFALVASAELYRLLLRAGHRPLWAVGPPLAVALALDAGIDGWRLFPHLLAVATLGVLAWIAFRTPRPDALVDWALTLAPALYVGGLLAYFLLLRMLPGGAYWVQVVLLCTWAADIAAYYVGRRWGRTKLAPALSPNKSVEGAIAGTAAALGTATVLGIALAPPDRSPLALAGLGLVVAVAGLIGDLAESFVKRQLGVKDSSGLFLGHGGVLDRLDSLLVAGMVAYYYLVATGG